MNVIQLFAIYGIIFLASRTAGLEKCQPAEEGQPYQLSYTLTTIPAHRTMLLWLKDGQLVSECPVESGDCSNNDISWFHARVEKRNNGVEFILVIQNVTRDNDKNAQGVWTLKTHSMEPTSQEIYSCALQVYAKAVDISCVTDVVTKGVTISCSTSRIYPEAMMSVYRYGHQLQSSSCANNKIPDNPMYFEAACKIIIPTEKLYLKRNSFDINIIPNVIGFSELKFLRTVKILTFHIAPGPFTQQNCTEAGTDVTCRCKRMDSKQFKSNFDWYLNNRIVKQKSDVYTFAKEQDASAVTDEKCQPAEEGQPYQMSYTLTTIPEYRKVLLWYKDGQLMSECPVEAGDCSNNDINWFQAKVVKKDEAFEFILNIENVTRGDSKNAEGNWTLKTHNLEPTTEDMYICVLQVYAKAKDVVCESDLVTEGAIISCTTNTIYPEAMIDVYRDGHKLQAASCESYKISDNPLYYRATCKIIIATDYLYVKQNNFSISIYPNIMVFMDGVLFGTVKKLTLQNGTTSQNQTALIAVTSLLIGTYLLIVALCVKKCNSSRKVLLNIRNHVCTKKADDDEDSRRSWDSRNIKAKDKCDVEKRLLAAEAVADKNKFKTTSSILLLGTRHSNKQLFKRSIINGDYTIEITQKLKTVVASKGGKELHKFEKSLLGNFPKVSLPDEGKISLHYTKRGDQVIKLVDGPEFNAYNEHKFIDDVKKCIVLSQEGYNAILVAFTEDGTKDCNLLLKRLHKTFHVDMNYVFPIFIYEKDDKLKGHMINEYNEVEKECGERLVKYNIENHTHEVNMLLVHISQMEKKSTRGLLCVHKEHFQRYTELEEILKELNLLFEICLDEPISMQDVTKVQLDHVKMLWTEYQGNNDKTHPINGSYNIEANQGETEGLETTNIESGTKQKLEIDSYITEVITNIMECLSFIYSGEEPIKRSNVILMKYLEESYQHLNDCYVSSVTKAVV